ATRSASWQVALAGTRGRGSAAWVGSSRRRRAGIDRGAEVDAGLAQTSVKCPVETLRLPGAELAAPAAGLPPAQKRVRLETLLVQRRQQGVEPAFVRFHEGETAALENAGPALGGDLQAAKSSDLTQAPLQVRRQILVAQEKDVGVVTVGPPALDVLEPRAVRDLPPEKVLEELRECPLELHVGRGEVVVGHGHVLAVAGDVDVPAR